MPDTRATAPGPRGGGPGNLGLLVRYRRDPAEFVLCTQRDYGEVSRIQFGPMVVHLVTQPEAVHRVLVANHGNYVRGALYDQFKLVVGRGLLTTDGDFWRAHRRAVQPVFLKKAVELLTPNVVRATAEMLDDWERRAATGEPVDLVTEMMRLTLVTLSRSLFGFDVRPLTPALHRVVETSVDVMFPHGYVREQLPSWLPTARNRLVARNKAVLDQLVEGVRRQHAKTGEGPLLALMEEARDPDTGRPWTEEEIRDEILTIYLAGHETTASGMCWALYSLARYPDVLGRLEAEVDEVLSGREPANADLERLDYTRMVVEETLRMYPPIWLYPRDTVGDDELGGYHVPGGTSILLSPLATHRNPRIWPNPEAFDPERFAPGADPDRPRISYFPFGAGARQCVGNLLALIELRVLVAMVAQRVRLHPVPGRFVRYGHSVISLRPRDAIMVQPHPRTGAATARPVTGSVGATAR